MTPGAGQTNGVVRLAEAGLLAPLGEASAAVIPPTTEGLYTFDGEVYGQPTSLSANGLIWNPDVAASAGIDDYPESFDDLLAACGDARSAGLGLHGPRRNRPAQPRVHRPGDLGDPRLRRRSGLERAARRGRRDLRGQRMEAGPRGLRRDERQRLLPGGRSWRQLRLHHGWAHRRHRVVGLDPRKRGNRPERREPRQVHTRRSCRSRLQAARSPG